MFRFFLDRKWFLWSILGTIIIFYATYYKGTLDLAINDWFGEFYDMIQSALSDPNSIDENQYYGQLFTFARIAGLYIVIAVILDFFIKHYVFRWRTSMNDYFTDQNNWQKLRFTEGASQRVQEDTRLFADIVQSLGVDLLRSLVTLWLFIPLLWNLGSHVTALPIIGPVDHGLVFVAIVWALLGTLGLALLGIKLPGLEYKNQMVEARYRKELVFGEDDEKRADPLSVSEFFGNVRRNYFRLFFHYMYFDVGKWSYLQFGVLIPYIALGPTIIAGAFTLGVMQQIIRAFGKVTDSLQFLVNSWSTIVKLISVWKRLREFERKLV
tara:strand:+ start:2955 stop:3926 length:972 start_codon:yes stop_codon:yes gene_type:complete